MSAADRRKDAVGDRAEGQASDEHARRVARMFGAIVRWYDPLNHILSGGLDRRWRACLADAVFPAVPGAADRHCPPRILDLAAGTLDVALALRRRHPDARIPAFDFCPPMLAHGTGKLQGRDKAAVWPVAADARALPLPEDRKSVV